LYDACSPLEQNVAKEFQFSETNGKHQFVPVIEHRNQ
jgi:hypothetical protein